MSLPLTSGQRGIWFDQLLHPEQPIYNMSGCLKIWGPVDRLRFEAATHELIRRTDALRIVLREGHELPTQEFLEDYAPPLEFHDLSAVAENEAEAWRLTRERIDRPLQLFGRPLFTFALIKLSENEYWWIHTYHHLIADAYAHSLMVAQLAAIYSGTPPPATTYSYADYIRADEESATSPKRAADIAYWQERFQTLPAPLVERKTFGAGIAHERAILTLGRPLYNRMEAFASSLGASTFHLILAALYVRFTRCAGREDFVIGLPTLNRNTAAFKQTVGHFTGVTPAWFALGLDLTAADLIAGIASELRRDYRHQRVPLHEINRHIGIHGQGRPQVFDIMLTYQKHSYDVQMNGHSVQQVSLRHGSEKTPLAIEVSEYNENLDVQVNIDYSVTAFTPTEIELFGEQLAFILDGMLSSGTTSIRELPILPPRERRLVLEGFNADRTRFAQDATLVDRFEAQVRRRPDAVAVAFDGRELTYAQLDTRAEHVAAALRSAGVGPGVLTGLSLERSTELVVGIIAILKAGGAYVPIDPAYPRDRQAFMLEDSGVRIIVTDTAGQRRLPPLPDLRTCLIDTIAWNGPAPSGADQPRARATDPAYLIYTSGSTGTPKGTLVSHHNVIRLFKATAARYGFGEHDVWTLFHSFAFDVSVWELFGALVHGGRLVVVPYWISRSPDEYYRLLDEQRVTVLNQTPSAFKQLILAEATRSAPLLPALRWVILAGEALDVEDLRPWFDRHGDERPAVINMYGITETTVHVTWRRIAMPDVKNGRSMVGIPMDDLRIYILDGAQNPVPVGVTGEIYVGGDGVALGYWQRPDLTAAAFIPDPFAPGNGRIYRSGDLARFTADGDIECLGRIDDQVKVRGFRVELGEVRNALQSHPGVREAAVLLRDRPQRLCAYVVPVEEPGPTVTELRAFLRRTLPDYMVPAAFVTLPSFPLTQNGKIDKRALPEPDTSRPLLDARFVAPANPLENRLKTVWTETLGLDRVGIHDNFFDLGGHSLLLVRVQHRIRTEFGRTLSMAEMFAYPTIHALAAALHVDVPAEPIREPHAVGGRD